MSAIPAPKAIIGQFINGRNSTDDFLQLATNHGGTVFGWIDAAGALQGTLANSVVASLNGLTGAVTLAAGSNITITPSGNTLTIAGTLTTPGGSNTDVQINNSGAFYGDGNFTYNSSTSTVSLSGALGIPLSLNSQHAGGAPNQDAIVKITNSAGVNTNPTYISKDESDTFTILTGPGFIQSNSNGTLIFQTGSTPPFASLELFNGGEIVLAGADTGVLSFLEGISGFQGGINQISFNMNATGTAPHGIWITDNSTRSCVFLQTRSSTLNGGSVYMQNAVGQSMALTQVSVSGGSTTYTGTITNGGSNQLAGFTITVSGFTNGGNNVTAAVTSSTGTTLVVSTTTQVNETHAGTAIMNVSSPQLTLAGSIWNGAAFADDTFTMQGVSPAPSNTNSILVFTHSGPGGSGNAAVEVGLLISSGNITANGLVAASPVNGGTAFLLQGNTPANSGANISSGVLQITGEYWTGAASADDKWTIEDVLGTGANPTSTLTFAHSGSTGTALVAAPSITVTAATPTGSSGQVSFGTTAGFGTGASGTAVTTTTKGGGTGPTTPQTVVNYLEIDIAGTKYWMPLVQ